MREGRDKQQYQVLGQRTGPWAGRPPLARKRVARRTFDSYWAPGIIDETAVGLEAVSATRSEVAAEAATMPGNH